MSLRTGWGQALVAAAGAVLVACGPHEDVTPAIAVQPGAAARAMALLGHGGPNYPSAARAPSVDGGAESERAEGTLAFSCLEARGAFKALSRIPCEVSVTPAKGTPTIGGEERLDLLAERGQVALPLPAGTYRVTASRGLEYARVSWDVEVFPGKTSWGPNEGATVLRRVLDTRGYLAADVRAWSSAVDRGGVDDPTDAVVQDAADGVEVVLGDAAGLVARSVQETKADDVLAVVAPRDLDALAVWNDRSLLFARLLSKQPVTAITSPPARTYVRVEDDGPVSTWSPTREADFVRGVRERRDVVLTTGPFLRVTANGAPIGGVAQTSASKDVEVRVHIECAPSVAVDRLSILRASGTSVEAQPVTLRPTPTDARSADAVFHLRATADDAFVVLADSSAPVGRGGQAGQAMTGALWIDADGDGESLGRR